jgi:maltose O-acetyltransferase
MQEERQENKQTEKQKMLAGNLYLASDSELVADSQRCARLLRLYSNTGAHERERRSQILRSLFGNVGENPVITPPFHCDYGIHISIGDNFYMNFGCVILDCNKVQIGSNVLCGPYVQIYAATHPIDPAVRLTGRELAVPVAIGNNVWIGGGAIICPGVTIGDNTTIGAGSVVVKDIPTNVLAVGNPCRVIRELGNER